MSTATYDNNINANSTCANCGKGEESNGELKSCTACKLVKYCNVSCQKAHRSQHKKGCRKRADELHDEKLFEQPPQKEDCPICFLRMPSLHTGNNYHPCCGKVICSGCIYAVALTHDEQLCPFCRALAPKADEDDEMIDLLKKRMEVDDAQAIYNLACHYANGGLGLTQDRNKALELWHRASELDYAAAYYNIGYVYLNGNGVERDEKKAIHYWELAAMGGDVESRHNLGVSEINVGNYGRAIKHFMISARSGDGDALKLIKRLFMEGDATRDDYAKALRAYQAYLDEIRSDDRDKAAAFSEEFKYYYD